MLELARAISLLATIFSWIVIASVLLSYFLPPYNPVREALDRIVDPFLAPIRRILPSMAGFDFSPVVLLLFIQILSSILVKIVTR